MRKQLSRRRLLKISVGLPFISTLARGASAAAAMQGGRFMDHGVHTIAPIVGRGVLLDIPASLGIESCPPGHEITAAELAATAQRQDTVIGVGDVVLVRSGWGRRFDEDAESYLGFSTGVPGVGEEGARWLASHGVLAAGADTVAFERLAPGEGHALLPAHRVLLVECKCQSPVPAHSHGPVAVQSAFQGMQPAPRSVHILGPAGDVERR